MHISDILKSKHPTFSFEFFPPKNAASAEQLFQTISSLIPLNPSFVSVTYGAGGTTRELTHDLVVKLQKETKLTVAAHLTCVGSTRDEMYKILEQYRASGIRNIMALRGDPPRGQDHFVAAENGFTYADELIAFVKKYFPDIGIGAAGYPEGHPETPNRLREIDNLKRKVDAGADHVCTQLFFDNEEFYDFCDRCELAGISVPILAGILPIISKSSMVRMADTAKGVRFPAKLLKALARAEDDTQFEKIGIHWATEQVLDLLDHTVKGIHFYTFNKSKSTLQIYDSLGIGQKEN